MTDGGVQRKRNIVTGYASLAMVAVAVAVIIAAAVYAGVRPGPKPYVMYVSNSGTIGPGDPVFMNGRHIGHITQSELVRRDGEVNTRVDVVVFERYRDLEFPTNSIAAIASPGLASGPRLILTIGDGGESIGTDGEFQNTSPASGTDTFTELGLQLQGADRQIDALIALMDDEQMIADVQQFLIEFRETADVMAARFEGLKPDLVAAVGQLDGASGRVDEIRESLRTNSDGMTDGIRRMSDMLANNDAQFAEFEQTTLRTIESIRAYEQATAEAAKLSRDPDLGQLFLDARWAAAELAAMADHAVSDPAAFGDAAGYLRSARKFNGGDSPLGPFGGRTDIDEEE